MGFGEDVSAEPTLSRAHPIRIRVVANLDEQIVGLARVVEAVCVVAGRVARF